MRIRKHWAERLGPVLFVAALLAIWQLLAVFKAISPIFFPSPLRTFTALWNQVVQGDLWTPLSATVLRMIFGWLAASIIGVVLGAMIAGSRLAKELLGPLLEFVRPIPASAFIPVAILMFGLSNNMSTAIIAFGSIWPVLLSAIQGFSSVDERLYEVADAMGMSRRHRFWKISLPSALPDIMAGARVGLAVALILAVVTEMQASLPGLGSSILMAQRSFRTPDLYASVVMLGCVGFLASALLQWVERRMLKWRLTA